MYELQRSTAARLKFVMADTGGNMVTGLVGALTILVNKGNGGSFNAATGAQGELGNGWYYYDLPAAEASDLGGLAVVITGAGAIQQNLLCRVKTHSITCVEFTYTVTDNATGNPIDGAAVGVSTDVAGNNVIWNGVTDALGVARDLHGDLPCLDAGTYYFWTEKAGYTFSNPDTEVVS